MLASELPPKPCWEHRHISWVRFFEKLQAGGVGHEENVSSRVPAQGLKEARPVVAEVVGAELGELLGGQTMAQYNEAFLEHYGTTSLCHRAAAARMMVLLDPQAAPAAAKMLTKRGGLLGEGRSDRECSCHSSDINGRTSHGAMCITMLPDAAPAGAMMLTRRERLPGEPLMVSRK